MFVVTVNFVAKAEHEDAFRTAVLAQAENSVTREAGCRAFDVASPGPGSGEFFLYELYDDEAAFQAHQQTAHFIDFGDKTKDMVESKTVATYGMISPTRGA